MQYGIINFQIFKYMLVSCFNKRESVTKSNSNGLSSYFNFVISLRNMKKKKLHSNAFWRSTAPQCGFKLIKNHRTMLLWQCGELHIDMESGNAMRVEWTAPYRKKKNTNRAVNRSGRGIECFCFLLHSMLRSLWFQLRILWFTVE